MTPGRHQCQFGSHRWCRVDIWIHINDVGLTSTLTSMSTRHHWCEFTSMSTWRHWCEPNWHWWRPSVMTSWHHWYHEIDQSPTKRPDCFAFYNFLKSQMVSRLKLDLLPNSTKIIVFYTELKWMNLIQTEWKYKKRDWSRWQPPLQPKPLAIFDKYEVSFESL